MVDFLKMPHVSDMLIIKTYFGNTHGIRGCALVLGVSKIRVGKVILSYKRKYNMR